MIQVLPKTFLNIFFLVCVLGEGHVQVYHMHMWRLEVNLLELVLSFSPVGPKDQSQVLRASSKYLYPMSNSDRRLHSKF